MVDAVREHYLTVNKTALSPGAYRRIINLLTYKNPNYDGSDEIPEFLTNCTETVESLKLPRQFPIKQFLKEGITVEDRRTLGDRIHIKSFIKLEEYQVDPVEEMMRRECGVLVAPCGAGKTVMGAEIIARRGVCTLVLVMKEFLMGQWAEELMQFTDATVGFLGGSSEFRSSWKDNPRVVSPYVADVIIGMIQTVYDGVEEGIVNRVGMIYSDEVHHAAAMMPLTTFPQFKPMYDQGTTATWKRTDGLERIYQFHTGPVRTEVPQEVLRKYGRTVQPKIQYIETGCVSYIPHTKGGFNFQVALNIIVNDPKRNALILDLTKGAEDRGRWTIVLSERVEHCAALCEAYNKMGGDGVVCVGQMNKEVKAKYGHLWETDIDKAFQHRVVFATISLVAEGLNQKHLNTVLLATPFSSETRTVQTIGRAVRACANKTGALVFDLVDVYPTLRRMAEKRRVACEAQGWVMKRIGEKGKKAKI